MGSNNLPELGVVTRVSLHGKVIEAVLVEQANAGCGHCIFGSSTVDCSNNPCSRSTFWVDADTYARIKLFGEKLRPLD